MERIITLTLQIEREGDQYVSICPELDVASYGDSIEDALAHLRDAVLLYLDTIDADGEQIPRGTLRSMRRQAGWTVEELTRLAEKYR